MTKVRRKLAMKINQIQSVNDATKKNHHFNSKVPKGYVRVEGDIYTGEGLIIKDFKSKAIYRWMKKSELFEEIDSRIKNATEKGMNSTDFKEKEKCNNFIKECSNLKSKISLKEGAFISENKKEVMF